MTPLQPAIGSVDRKGKYQPSLSSRASPNDMSSRSSGDDDAAARALISFITATLQDGLACERSMPSSSLNPISADRPKRRDGPVAPLPLVDQKRLDGVE